MSRPADAPEWASDVNYGAGADPWSATPTKVEPTDGEKDAGATPLTGFGAQQLNWLLNNHANFLNYLESCIFGGDFQLKDHFYKAALDTAIWTAFSSGGSSDPAIAADGAADGIGAVHPLTAGSGTSSITSAAARVGTNDFGIGSRVRVASSAAIAAFIANNDILLNGGGFEFGFKTGATNWFASTGGTDTDTGTAWAATYQDLKAFRVGGVAYFFINGVLEHSAANVVNYSDATLRAKALFATTNGSMYNDTLSLWVGR